MKTKSKKADSAEPSHTTKTNTPSLFTPADRKRLKPLLSKDLFDQLMHLKEYDKMPCPLIDSDGNEICNPESLSINWWNDDRDETIYQIGKRAYVYDKIKEVLIYSASDAADVILKSGLSDTECFEEKCAEFGIKPPLNPVKRGEIGPCRIWISTSYRAQHLQPVDFSHWLRDDHEKIIWFDSYVHASRWINRDKKNYEVYGYVHNLKDHDLRSDNKHGLRLYSVCK